MDRNLSRKVSTKDLGEPDLDFAGFQLWIHGREDPDSKDYYDGNWLRITAHCVLSGATVWVQGAALMATDIAGLGAQCEAMLRGDADSASMDPLEPMLKISLEAEGSLGHIRTRVEITPDHLAQFHRMEFDLDQSYLPGIVRQCSAIVREYPIRGNKDG